ncbi:hypothetical protein BGZ89_011904 [Linnemannia elongata]|nr:hypothetical protein BGZ89_011904 [Linnemannia elongata]
MIGSRDRALHKILDWILQGRIYGHDNPSLNVKGGFRETAAAFGVFGLQAVEHVAEITFDISVIQDTNLTSVSSMADCHARCSLPSMTFS